MPFSDKTKEEQEEIKRRIESAISLTDFRQFVDYNIPFNGYVFGVSQMGKINYTPSDPNNLIVLIPDSTASGSPSSQVKNTIPYRPSILEEDQRKNPFFWLGSAWGGFSIFSSWKAFDMSNQWYWTSHATSTGKSVRMPTEILADVANGARFRGWGPTAFEDMTKVAGKAAPLGKVAKRVTWVGVVIPITSMAMKGEVNVEDTTDLVFACIGFVLGVGWVISGIYTVSDVISVSLTGKKIATHHKERWIELGLEWLKRDVSFKAWLNTFTGPYGMP